MAEIKKGEKFGEWTILKKGESNKHRQARWLCQCSCGVQRLVFQQSLKNGASKSCRHRRMTDDEVCFNDLFLKYKSGAARKNLKFELSKDICRSLFKDLCHYCTEPPKKIYKLPRYKQGFTYNGIDRLDSSLGYISYNVVSCCSFCNYKKGSMPYVDFLSWIKKVAVNMRLDD